MVKLPRHYNKEETTRSRSKEQETGIADALAGRVTINSGATLGENDIILDYAEIEAKTTDKASNSLKMSDWDKLVAKCDPAKIPMMIFEFRVYGVSLAVIGQDDLELLIQLANKNKQSDKK